MQKIGKEIKIGLAVIGVLVAAFGYILFRRLTKPDDLAAAPPAAAAPSATTTAAGTSDKPTVVSATDTGRPADASNGGGASSRSLFGSARRLPASDSSDTAADPRGSFMPAANNDPAANNAASAPPESRFSQFGHQDNAPSNDGSTKPHNRLAADGNRSLFTAGNTAPPADPLASAPSAVAAPAAITASAAIAAPSDPFQRNSAPPADPVASDTPNRNSPSPLDAPASTQPDPFQRRSATIDSPPLRTTATDTAAVTPTAGQMPADPSPAQQAAPSDPNDGNPLRHPHEHRARTESAASPDTAPTDAPRSMFGATAPPASASVAPTGTYASAQTVPPPITANAINVPSAQTAPPEPINSNQPPMTDASPHRPGQYVVQPNDNYWTVSEKVYGTGGYFKAIYEHNRRQHSQSDRLQVGDTLDVPDVAVLQQAYPDLCPKLGGDAVLAPATTAAASTRPQPPGTRSYSVADGDTLYEIARRELGNASRWGEIYQLNHDQLGNDFGYLRPGTQLLIPSDGGATTVAREPSGVLQR